MLAQFSIAMEVAKCAPHSAVDPAISPEEWDEEGVVETELAPGFVHIAAASDDVGREQGIPEAVELEEPLAVVGEFEFDLALDEVLNVLH